MTSHSPDTDARTAAAAADEALFREKGFGRPIGFGTSPALLVIDAMKAFTNPEHPLGAEYSDEMDALDVAIAHAREAGLPVIHTVVQYEHPELLDAGLWRIKQAGSWQLRVGTEDVQIADRVDVREEDQIVVKKYASAFFGTDLVSRLNGLGVDTVLIAGFTTSGCVRATAVDALQNGYRPIVLKEAVGDRSGRAHAQALFDLEQKYADVVSVDDLAARNPPDGGSAR